MKNRSSLFQAIRRSGGDADPALDTGRTRLLFTAAMFACAFAVIGLRLVDVTLLKEGNEPTVAERRSPTVLPIGRADIVDRNGVLLATSLKTASLYADPHQVLDPKEAVAKLVKVLPDLNEAEVYKHLTANKKFVWIYRHLTPHQQYQVNRLGIPGLDFLTEERRVYPAGPLAAHLLGFTDVDNRGLAGIEREFDKRLRDSAKPLRLSIDVRIQHAMRFELSRAMHLFRAVGAAGLVEDVRTGEILAMVSLPDFDPNLPNTIDPETRFNRATLGVYEMGSTFKLFTAAMALDSGKVTLQSGYDATNPIHIARFTIHDDHAKRRWLSIPEIIMYSSNIGAAKMALDVGPEGQRAFLAKVGMLRPAHIELPEVGEPLVPNPWREINTMTIAFGHGIAVSPIQLVDGVSALVNGGIFRPATVLKRDGTGAVPGTRVISPHTSDDIRRLMRLVVLGGTGKFAEARGFLVGGKTGTAEKVFGKRYKTHALMSSFIGAFPINAPRYVVYAMLDEPSGNKQTYGYATGGWVAAPVVRNVVFRMASILGIHPVDEDSPEIRQQLAIDVVSKDPSLRRAKAASAEHTGKRRLASF